MLYGIDIFSGAGGLSIGAEMAGVQIMFAVEKDKYAAETYSFNHKNIPVICEDIHNIDPVLSVEAGISAVLQVDVSCSDRTG